MNCLFSEHNLGFYDKTICEKLYGEGEMVHFLRYQGNFTNVRYQAYRDIYIHA